MGILALPDRFLLLYVFEHLAHVGLCMQELGAVFVVGMSAQHSLYALHAVLICRQFVLFLSGMYGKATYFPFTLASECLAHCLQHGCHDAVEEVVPTHVKICALWRQS